MPSIEYLAEFIPHHPIEIDSWIKSTKFYARDGVKTINDLKPVKEVRPGVFRYDFHQMRSIIVYKIGCDIREYGPVFKDFIKVPLKELKTQKTEGRYGRSFLSFGSVSDDFWSEFQINMLWSEVQNDQVNTLYIGLDEKYIQKKLGRKATLFEMELQKIFYETFKHLTYNKKRDAVKVDLWW